MARKGRFLEILVEHLQRFLSDDGIVVKSPEEFYRDGKKIGEIDITLRGEFGSSRLFVGIECRDRPGGPRQGRDWIRELIGEKRDLQIDQIVAVSTTGFTQQAIALANAERIDLLTFSDVDAEDPSHWIQSFSITIPDGSGNGVTTTVLLNVCRRESTDETLAMTGVSRVVLDKRNVKIVVLIRRNKGNATHDVRLSFFTEDDKPLPLATGTQFTLYGNKREKP
jgi:hypothetical protein